MTLTYSHLPGQEISVSRVSHGNGDATVSYRVKTPRGNTVMMFVTSTTHLDAPGGKVLYPDGREVKCTEVDPDKAETGRS